MHGRANVLEGIERCALRVGWTTAPPLTIARFGLMDSRRKTPLIDEYRRYTTGLK
jgi:hypothetical protein